MKALVARSLSSRYWPLLVGALAIVVTLPALWTGFIVDDLIHRAIFQRLPGFRISPFEMFSWVPGADRTGGPILVSLPWWAAPDLKLAFWRPLTAVTHLVDYALWPNAAWLMHLHSMLWYGAVVVLVSVLFGVLLQDRRQAALAAFVYAVSHTHAMPVFFLANRNALVGVFFGVAALLLHHRWRSSDRRDGGVFAPLALLLGLLANEGTTAAFAYVFAYALFIDRGTLRSRALSLAPYLVVIVLWRLYYDANGYGSAASEAYIDPGASPRKFVAALFTRAPVYLMSQWLFPPAEWSVLMSESTRGMWAIVAIAFLLLLLFVLLPILKQERIGWFWLTGMALSIVPSCATFPMDRMLLYTGIGAAALLSQFVTAVYGGAQPPSTAIRRLVTRVVFDVLVALHLVLAPLRLPITMQTTARMFDHMTDGMEALAARPDLSGKLIVVVDDTLDSSAYFPALRALAGGDPAGRLLVLAPVRGRFTSIVVSRLDANTLVMTVEGGYNWFLERDREHPFAKGDTVNLGRVHVDVQEVDPGGKPTRVAFRFDTALEHETIAWFGRLEPARLTPVAGSAHPAWQPPAVGQTVSVR